MNGIGRLEMMIVKYQQPVEAAAAVLSILLAVFFIVKIVKHAKQKEKLLSEISHNVAKISTNVNRLNEKKTEVVFIDSRLPKTMPSAETPVKLSEEREAVREADGGTGGKGTGKNVLRADAEESVLERQMESHGKDKAAEEKIRIPFRFSSRDCSVSKQGRTYTVEELMGQIKE